MKENEEVLAAESQVTVSRHLLREAEKALAAARLKQLKEDRGIELGSIVKDQSGDEFQVCEIEATSYGAHLKGNPRKANGDWSAAVRNIYGWDKSNRY